VAGLAATPVCVTLSDQVTSQGPVPVSAASIVVELPLQIVAPPLTVAVGGVQADVAETVMVEPFIQRTVVPAPTVPLGMRYRIIEVPAATAIESLNVFVMALVPDVPNVVKGPPLFEY